MDIAIHLFLDGWRLHPSLYLTTCAPGVPRHYAVLCCLGVWDLHLGGASRAGWAFPGGVFLLEELLLVPTKVVFWFAPMGGSQGSEPFAVFLVLSSHHRIWTRWTSTWQQEPTHLLGWDNLVDSSTCLVDSFGWPIIDDSLTSWSQGSGLATALVTEALAAEIIG